MKRSEDVSFGRRLGRRICLSCVASVLLFFFTAGTGNALSPPWWLYYSYLANSVGKTPGVTVRGPVEDTSDHYVINVIVKNEKRRSALATLIASSGEAAGMDNLIIQVTDPAGGVEPALVLTGTTTQKSAKLKTLFTVAFRGNPFYGKTEMVNSMGFVGAFPIFHARLVQFFADDLSDYYGRQTYVARDLFQIVLNQNVANIPIYPSTQPLAAGSGATLDRTDAGGESSENLNSVQ